MLLSGLERAVEVHFNAKKPIHDEKSTGVQSIKAIRLTAPNKNWEICEWKGIKRQVKIITRRNPVRQTESYVEREDTSDPSVPNIEPNQHNMDPESSISDHNTRWESDDDLPLNMWKIKQRFNLKRIDD